MGYPRIKHLWFTALLAGFVGFIINISILSIQLKYMPYPPTYDSAFYLYFATIGYQFMVWVLLSLITYGVGLYLKRFPRVYFLLLSLVIIIVNLLYYINVKIYALYKFHLNKTLVDFLLKEAMGDLSTVNFSPLLTYFGIALILASAVYLTLVQLTRWLEVKYIFMRPFLNSAFIFLVMLYVGTQFLHMYADARGDVKITFWSRHIPYYQPLTGKRLLIKMGLAAASSHQKLKGFKDPSINYPFEVKFKCLAKDKPKNIVYILIDSLRFDSFNSELMPKTYTFVNSQKNVKVFNNHFSGGNATSTGLFSLFYSIPGTYYKNFSNSHIAPLFFKILENNGYETQISVSSDLDTTTFGRNVFKDIKNLRTKPLANVAWDSDEKTNKEFIDFLNTNKKNQKPFFGFLFYDSVHDYSFPETFDMPFKDYLKTVNYGSLGIDTDPKPIFNKYKNSVAYVDQLLSKVLSQLSESRLLDQTVLVISSDHGEEFNDNKMGYWGHNSNFSDTQVKVPLIIIEPKTKKETVDSLTSHYDISSHIFDKHFDCPNYKSFSLGKGLSKRNENSSLILSSYSNGALKMLDHTYVFDIDGSYEVFDRSYSPLFDVKISPKDFSIFNNETSRYYN